MRHQLSKTSLLCLSLLSLAQADCSAARCDDPAIARQRAVETSAQLEPLATVGTPNRSQVDFEGTVTHITSALDQAGTTQLRIEVSGAHPGVLTAMFGARPAFPLHEGDAVLAHFECSVSFRGRFCSGYITDPKGALLLAIALDRDELAPGFRCELAAERCTSAGDLIHEVRFFGPGGVFVTSDNRWEILRSHGSSYEVWGSAREVIDRSAPDSSDARSCVLVRRSP